MIVPAESAVNENAARIAGPMPDVMSWMLFDGAAVLRANGVPMLVAVDVSQDVCSVRVPAVVLILPCEMIATWKI